MTYYWNPLKVSKESQSAKVKCWVKELCLELVQQIAIVHPKLQQSRCPPTIKRSRQIVRSWLEIYSMWSSSGFEAILFHSSFHISFSRLWASYPGMFALQTQSKALKPGIELHSGAKSARHANWKAFPIHSGQVNPQNKAGPVMLSLGWCHNAPLITETLLKLYNSYANVQLNKSPTRKSDGILPSHAEDSLL